MGKKTSYPKGEYRRLLRSWLLRHMRVVAVMALLFVATVAAEIALLRIFPSQEYVRYVVVALLGATFVGLCWAIHTLFLAHEGTAINHLRGAWGEDNTATELSAAQRQGLVWGYVDALELGKGDIDHLAVTRRGGIVVVDSKWCSNLDDGVRSDFAASAVRAAQRGRGLISTVTQRSHGRHSAPRTAMTVTPVVVVWGAAQSSVRDNEVVDGVPIVRGSGFRTWLARLEGELIPQKTALELVARIEAFDDNRRTLVQDRERSRSSVVPT